jgi:glucose uptake protein GlcU
MAFSIVAMAVGAVMYWAVTAQANGFRYSTVGVILMVIGAVGLVASAIVFGVSRRSTGGRRTYDREVIDAQGRSAAVHEEVR